MHFIYVIYDTCVITGIVEQGHLCQSEQSKDTYLGSTRAAVLLGAAKQSNGYNKNGMRQVEYGEKIVKVHTNGMTDDNCDNESMRQADKQHKMDIPTKGTSNQSQTVQHVTCNRQRCLSRALA